MKNCSVFASLISPSKMILFEKKYQTFDTVFHHQMKHLEVRQKYSAARRIFNSLLGVSSGDETLHLMFDILHETLRLMFDILHQMYLNGIEWYLEKHGSQKIWPSLEISKAFLMGFKVSFSGDFCISESFLFCFFFCLWVLESQICHFFFS